MEQKGETKRLDKEATAIKRSAKAVERSTTELTDSAVVSCEPCTRR